MAAVLRKCRRRCQLKQVGRSQLITMVENTMTKTLESSRSPRANFFLVGAPKAGTTSLDRLLRSHPDVFLSPIKEPCHFCPDVTAQLRHQLNARAGFDLPGYLASPDKAVIHFQPVASPEHYARLFDGAG